MAHKIGYKRMESEYVLIKIGKHLLFPGRVWVLEHRFKVAVKLGRKLSRKEIVHHKNEVKSDNRLRNLYLTSNKGHALLHLKSLSERAKEQHRTGSLGVHTLTPEGRKRLSESAKKARRLNPISVEQKAKMSVSATHRWTDPKQRRIRSQQANQQHIEGKFGNRSRKGQSCT